MAKTLLAWIGGAALVGCAVAGITTWKWVGDGVHVTLQPVDAEDPAQQRELLLEDSVQALRQDLQGLTEALERNLNQLVQALQAEAATDRQRAAEDRAGLEQRLTARLGAVGADDATAAELALLVARIEALSARVEDLAGGAGIGAAGVGAALAVQDPDVDGPAVGDPGPAGPGAADAGAEAAAAVPAATDPVAGGPDAPAPDVDEPVAPAEVPEAAPAAAPSSFLSFTLPSDDFDPAELRTWEFQPGLSRVGFDAKSTLHDFTGATTAVEGTFRVRVGDPELGIEGRVVVPLERLATGLEDRDEAMLEHLATAEHPEATFEPRSFRRTGEAPADAAGPHAGVLTGALTLRGVEREVEVPVTYSLDDAHRLLVEGEATVHLPDHEIPVPNRMGMIKMDPDVRMWVSLRAKVAAREGSDAEGSR